MRPGYKVHCTRRLRIFKNKIRLILIDLRVAAHLIFCLQLHMSTKEIREYLRKIGKKGGEVTNQKLTPEQRRESARRAAQARWAKAKKKSQ